jgi:hypothetical protein
MSTNFPASRALPSLARAGVLITRHKSAEVAFEVHHLADRPGYLFGLHSGEASTLSSRSTSLSPIVSPGASLTPDDDREPYFETLSAAAHGGGLVVRTAVRPVGSDINQRQGLAEPTAPGMETANPLVWVFKGSAQPNPSFIYESTSALEGLVVLEVEPQRLLVSHGEAIREVVTRVADVAVGVNAPLLYVQSPAQLPAPSFTPENLLNRENDWSRSCSLAVRFAIAIGQRSSRERCQLAASIADYCSERGWGLELQDTRPGHRSGNWFSVVQHDEARVRARIGTPGARNLRAVNWACPVTFVGPARVGSTRAIFRLLATHDPASVAGVSIASLDDLVFIHLLLALPEGSREAFSFARDGLAFWTSFDLDTDVNSRFRSLLTALGHRKKDSDGTEGSVDVLRRAGDYQIFAGPLVEYKSMEAAATRPLWISWDIERTRNGLTAPLTSLASALTKMGLLHHEPVDASARPSVNVEYLICRDVGDATLRAKGKVGVPDKLWRELLPTYPRAEAGRRLAQVLEEYWQAANAKTESSRGELTVAWQEPWLGRGSIRL